MKNYIIWFLLLIPAICFGQLEITSGYGLASSFDTHGFPLMIGYEFKIKERLFTKTQAEYKNFSVYNDYVGANFGVRAFGIHQTISYEIIRKAKYILKPNIGLNYRFVRRKGEMLPPFDPDVRRSYYTDDFLLTSDEQPKITRYFNNHGYSIQLQNQFFLYKHLWLHLTPFLEMDYLKDEIIGGLYVGLIFKNL